MTTHATIHPFFDPTTWTVTDVVADPSSRRAAIIDPVLEDDFKSGRTRTTSADAVKDFVISQGLTIDWILETHAHADHVSSATCPKDHLGGQIAIGENICTVQATFKTLFTLEESFEPDGRAFDHLFHDGEVFQMGSLQATAMLVPGPTPADMAYLQGDAVFVGDTLFMPDVGTPTCLGIHCRRPECAQYPRQGRHHRA